MISGDADEDCKRSEDTVTQRGQFIDQKILSRSEKLYLHVVILVKDTI